MRVLVPRRPGLALALLAALCACSTPPPDDAARDQLRQIPMRNDDGSTVMLAARVCRPAGDAPARVVVVNHGSPANSAARPRMELEECDGEASRWFLRRGYIVVYALRRGYGDTGGGWAETYGSCRHPDYVDAGLETARDIAAIVDYATALPFARPDGAIVVGQSAGGWGTIAYASLPHPRVAALIVFAGGRGGHRDDIPDSNCGPDRLAEAAGLFGRTSRTPMLWVYARNDTFFRPEIAEALHAAFTASGGQATFVQPAAYDDEGHRLFLGDGGSAIWGPLVARYLAQRGIGSPSAPGGAS